MSQLALSAPFEYLCYAGIDFGRHNQTSDSDAYKVKPRAVRVKWYI